MLAKKNYSRGGDRRACTGIGNLSHLPDDFIPPLPHAASACGNVIDVDHGDLDSTPST